MRCASMAAPSWSRSTRCSNSIAGFWKSCGRWDWRNSGFAKRLARCCGCGASPIPTWRSRPRFRRALGETGETADLTIYRVVQEALTNVFRHAGATSVNVTHRTCRAAGGTQAGRGCALVRVRDNGRGLKPDHRLGLGLIGMRERILALGGTLTVASGDGGVTVEALVPNGSHRECDRDAVGPGIFPEFFGKNALGNRTFCGSAMSSAH